MADSGTGDSGAANPRQPRWSTVAAAANRAAAWAAVLVADLGAAPPDPEARARRLRRYRRPGMVALAPPDVPPPAPAGAGARPPDAAPAAWLDSAVRLAPGMAPVASSMPGGSTSAPVPSAGGPDGSAWAAPEAVAADDTRPDFPPEGGPAPVPAEPLWGRYAIAALVLAAAAWFYIRGAWPGIAHAGGFDHNAWEAAALLRGHVFTPPPPPGDTLDMMYYRGRWASFFPPMGAFLLMPLVWYYRNPLAVPVREFCALLGALCPLFVYQMAERAGLRLAVRLWLTVLFAFGTVFWYAVDTGSPWYYVQVVTEFFYLLALRESFGRNRPVVVGSLFGAALLSRNTVALGVAFLFWRERRWDWRRLAGFLGPVAAAVGVQLWWNWARTGDALDTGYGHILMNPGFRASFAQGMFSIQHIPWQIYSIFFMAPAFHGQGNFNAVWPLLSLSGQGQSLLLTTPAFLYALEGDVRRRRVWLGSAAVLCTAVPQLLYYANGTGQFGNRFSLDYTPLLMALLMFGVGRRFRWQHAALILASIFLSGYGAVYAAHVHLVPPGWLAGARASAAAAPVHAAARAPAASPGGFPAGGCPAFPWLRVC